MKHVPTKFVPDSLMKDHSNFCYDRLNKITEDLQKTLTKLIGKPIYSNNGFILYESDFLKSAKQLETIKPFIDLTVTSPPYNIGKEYEENISIEEYVMWSEKWMNTVFNLTKSHGSFWLNVGHFEVPEKGKCVPIPYLIWDKSNFYLIQEVVWRYGAGVHTKKRLSPRNEKWLLYAKNLDQYTFNLDEIRDPNVKYPNQKKDGKLKNNPLGKNPSDVWDFPKVTSGGSRSSKERTDHPAQFPLKVVERAIRASSNQNEIILDPFIGSGTTTIAANALGRVCLGFEINKDYCNIAIKRHKQFIEYRKNYLSQTRFNF